MAYNETNTKNNEKSPKDYKNFSKENSLSESEENKEYIAKILIDFNNSQNNSKLDEMISDLINYRKQCEHYNEEKNNLQPPSSSKKLLFQYLEKNLIEFAFLKNKDILENGINCLFYWYKDKNKRHEDLRYMIMKSYKEKNEIDEEEYINQKLQETNKEIEEIPQKININPRNNLADKKMLSDYIHKTIIKSKIDGGKVINPIKSITKNNNFPIVKTDLVSKEFFDSDFSQFYSTKYGSHLFSLGKKNYEKSFKDKAPGIINNNFGESFVKNNNANLFPPLNHETKFSYCYNRPEYHYKILSVEKQIIQNKMENLAEQRSQKEILNKVNEFGLQRAKYKENLNNKYELKNVINMYTNQFKFQSPLLEKYKIINEKQKSTGNLIKIPIIQRNNDLKKNSTSISVIDEKKTNENLIFDSSKKLLPVPQKKQSGFDMSVNLDNEKKIIRAKRSSLRKLSKNQSMRLIPKKIINISGLSSEQKIKTNDIKNIENSDKNIIDQKDDVKKIKIKMKLINENRKIYLSSSQKNFNVPSDTVGKLIANDSFFKEGRTYAKLCNIKNNNNASISSYINSKSQEDSENYSNNFYLSAFDQSNIKKINENKSFIGSMKDINNYAKYKINRLHNTFNLYKNNLLNLRRTMSDWKKNDYDLLVSQISKNIDSTIDYEEPNNDRDYLYKNNSVDYLMDKSNLIKNIKLRKEKSLLNAMVNPNDNTTYSRFFLPRSGSMLLSRTENQNAMKKK